MSPSKVDVGNPPATSAAPRPRPDVTPEEEVPEAEALADDSREQVFEAFQRWGYLEADLDPLGFLRPQQRPELNLSGAAADAARRAYCGTIGVEFMHIADPGRRRWLQQQIESPAKLPNQARVLERLIRADLFEQVMQAR